MDQRKTYFEQVPLKIVKKIVDEELRREELAKAAKTAAEKIR